MLCGVSPGMDEGWIIPELPHLYSVPCQAVLVQAVSTHCLSVGSAGLAASMFCRGRHGFFSCGERISCLSTFGGSWRGYAWGRTGSLWLKYSSCGKIGKEGLEGGWSPDEQWRPTWTTSLLCAGYAGCRPGTLEEFRFQALGRSVPPRRPLCSVHAVIGWFHLMWR